MRVFLISNVPGSIDRLVDMLGQVCSVVAKEVGSDVNGMGKSVNEAVKNGYGLVIAVPDDPVAAGMQFNKYDAVNAASCSSDDDIKKAFADSANVLILSGYLHSYAPIIERLRSVEGGADAEAKLQKAAHKEKAARPEEKKPEKEEKPAKEPRHAEKAVAETEHMPKARRKGLFNSLKDSLGILDEQ